MTNNPPPPPPEAGAIPEPTELDYLLELDYWYNEADASRANKVSLADHKPGYATGFSWFHRDSFHRDAESTVQALIRRLAAAERDRDDARRRVEDMIELRNAIRQLHAVSIPPQDISGRRMWYESWRTLDAFLAQSAPGTGGTTGGNCKSCVRCNAGMPTHRVNSLCEECFAEDSDEYDHEAEID
jgi:hypothetical protein